MKWVKELENLKELLNTNSTATDIAEVYNSSAHMIRWVCAKYKLNYPYKVPRLKQIYIIPIRETHINWDEEIENIKVMVSQGMSSINIGKHYNYSRQMIDFILRKYNISKNRPSKSITTINRESAIYRNAMRRAFRQDKELYNKYKHYSKRKAGTICAGKEFTIPFNEIEWPDFCPILGIKLDYYSKLKRTNNTISFDRIDNSKGYISGNVLVCSFRANKIKNDATTDELIKIANFYSILTKKINENK